MEAASKKYYIVLRVCLAVLLCVAEIVAINMLWVAYTAVESWLWFVLVQLCLLWFNIWAACRHPWVGFNEKSIQVMLFFKTKVYQWEELEQIGILNKHLNGQDYPELYILLPGGSPMKRFDIFFKIRNIGRLICIPNTPQIREYITKHYGPLNFDLSGGK